MRNIWIVSALAAAALCIAAADPAPAAEEGVRPPPAVGKAAAAQTTCPVMGGKIDKALFVDHAGKRIYVCCRGCIRAVRADPEKYIAKLESEGVVLEAVPAGEEAGRR